MFFKHRLLGHILDTTPLRDFIRSNLNFELIDHAIKNQHIKTIEIISNCYETQKTISFYQHYTEDFKDWSFPLHSSQRVKLQTEYFLASTSFPLFFPPEKINGFHYGDGHVGLEAPLRGAINCKVDKILVIGTHRASCLNTQVTLKGSVDFACILSNLINGLFLDNMDRDLDMVNNMNNLASLISSKEEQHWRPIQTLYLRPSKEISSIAQSQYQNIHIPVLLRLLLNFLGAKHHAGDLLSFLLFEKEFTREVIKLGFEDTMSIQDSIITFFNT